MLHSEGIYSSLQFNLLFFSLDHTKASVPPSRSFKASTLKARFERSNVHLSRIRVLTLGAGCILPCHIFYLSAEYGTSEAFLVTSLGTKARPWCTPKHRLLSPNHSNQGSFSTVILLMVKWVSCLPFIL